MRLKEFVRECTVSGGIATVAQPLGGVITRTPKQATGKYMNSAPTAPKRKSKNAR